ncbi:hypothetical protein D3C79_700560 [compost metagenome]
MQADTQPRPATCVQVGHPLDQVCALALAKDAVVHRAAAAIEGYQAHVHGLVQVADHRGQRAFRHVHAGEPLRLVVGQQFVNVRNAGQQADVPRVIFLFHPDALVHGARGVQHHRKFRRLEGAPRGTDCSLRIALPALVQHRPAAVQPVEQEQ